MSNPIYIHVQANGDIWVTADVQDTPTGTNVGIYKVSDAPTLQKIGTLSGTFSSSLAASNTTGKYGKKKS